MGVVKNCAFWGSISAMGLLLKGLQHGGWESIPYEEGPCQVVVAQHFKFTPLGVRKMGCQVKSPTVLTSTPSRFKTRMSLLKRVAKSSTGGEKKLASFLFVTDNQK